MKRYSRADVRGLVVRNETGLHEAHYLITVLDIADAPRAIVEAFDAAVSRHRTNRDFGGDIIFVVFAPTAPGPGLAAPLEEVRSQLESRIAQSMLVTRTGRPFRVKVQQRKWLPVES